MPHVFFGLTMASAFALCAFRVLPSGEFVDIGKWVTILYAISTTTVAVVRHIWPRSGGAAPSFDNLAVTDATPVAPTFNSRSYFDDAPRQGVEFLGPFGSLGGDVFADALGDNYTSMIRDHDAPPVTTEGADGSAVMVPTESEPSLENLAGRRSTRDPWEFDEAILPLDFGQVRARHGVYGPVHIPPDITVQTAKHIAAPPNVVVLGDPDPNLK